ncbi:hypothetical protein ACFU6R_06070 [Streptomyces sp. NPDC057499]|uniref:hypothetical protein n=1 Tax=Streptomyces sp. NPDC057499 TaxID=3346150 RepID=UPI0036AC896F
MGLTEHPLIRRLLSLDLAIRDFVVAGSGPLLAHGIRESVGDLDIVARGAAWRAVTDLAEPVPALSGHGCTVSLFDGSLEFFDRWLPGGSGADALIDGAEFICGIPFCPLPEVFAWKQRSNRSKDREDLLLIRRHIEQNGLGGA